ncbi:MAG: transglutaminase family protein, partial [Opitutales bacterium]|nr:transglutaminase family protein [Opitutales bacterium]
LTMGGEPTFVSIDDMEGAEWNTAAVGPMKRKLSEDLLRRLWLRFGKGGFLHYGQGKWYPGESLPRWAFSCYWRKDGQALWTDPSLLADIEKDYSFDVKDAELFSETLAKVLNVRVDIIMPAYEDTWYYLWKERKLPGNVDPLDNKIKDPEERERLSKIFESELDRPKGYVLPVQKMWQAKQVWVSTPWNLRQPKLFLTPGDSPIGLRLPLESMPWVSENNYPYIVNEDPFAPRDASLGASVERVRQYQQRAQKVLKKERKEEDNEEDYNKARDPDAIARTAICVEARQGKLFVFIPPVSTLEDYLDLVSAIEATASVLKKPVLIEGEKPPHDPRIEQFSVTPDPGVIEVNVQPATSWKDWVYNIASIYEDARQCRLGTSKYMLDGRHTGTGGGNHIVMGGKTPDDSPFLRRPDLLRSMIAYWHHHPSLSYLFSSIFMGPTSQSPRVDEARDDALYEMEIAFQEVENAGGNCPPWLTDRIFRNLLVDITGNTHRAEFCIDKLYSPDSSSGRLGLLELRSFEMPPSARMSLAQSLLLRGLVAHFWEKPYYPRRLMRWGTDLHDRMMLPHYIWEDLLDILEDLQASGLAFEADWYKAHLEFRCPLCGKVKFKDMSLELHQALEPWHVMGEEGMAGGTARCVDSSLERVQVKVKGFHSDRYIVACNRERVPLRSTGVQGEYVAGVRYRAWQPPSSLHPTIPVDTPLIFDIVDTWTMRAVAGCRYHVAHPGGRNYDVFPVNTYEAESRRLSRFEPHGYSPEPYLSVPEVKLSVDFPGTLDLRRGMRDTLR